MKGIPTELHYQLREGLLRCGPFDSHEELSAIFVNEALWTWRDNIPQVNNRAGRVEALIHYLYDAWDENGRNGLLSFLQVLHRLTDPNNACQQTLNVLISQLESVLQRPDTHNNEEAIQRPPRKTGYDLLEIRDFLVRRVDLREFCFVLEHQLNEAYAHQNLRGGIDSQKWMSLVMIAQARDEIGELVWQLAQFWLYRVYGNPRLLLGEGIYEALDYFRWILSNDGQKKRAAEVENLLQMLQPNAPLTNGGNDDVNR